MRCRPRGNRVCGRAGKERVFGAQSGSPIERGTFEFSVTVPFSQLAKFCRMTEKGVKKRCERLRDDWDIVSWKLSSNRNHGNDFSVCWEAEQVVRTNSGVPQGRTTRADSGEVLESPGGVPERKRGVLKGSGGVPARTPSVLSGLSGLSDETIAIADASPDTDQEQETAGETPATPTLRSTPDVSSESEFEESVSVSGFGDPVSFRPASTPDFAALPSWETEPARCLANYLFCFLSVREDVEVLPGWEKFWTKDFQEALDSGWSLPDLEIAIRMSQCGKAQEYYKRGASIVAQLDLLVCHGRKLQERGLLVEVECQHCHGLFVGDDAFEHIFDCYRNKPIDPEDAAEEEAMDLADELVSEGYVAEHPDLRMFYPWGDDDKDMSDPWADVPEQLPEPTGEQMPY